MFQLSQKIWNSKDLASAVLLGVIFATALWIVALPLSKSVQEAYLRRFHLASPGFAVWAIQQPVPAMYNFENRVWASRTPVAAGKLADSNVEGASRATDIETDPVNHFPTRSFTFGRTRSFLKQNPSWYYYLRSRYRGREIRSAFQISPVSESEVQVNHLEVTID